MKIQCKYCNTYVSTSEETCPYCGAVNDGFQRTANKQPKTIEELKQWYTDRKLPPYSVTRFFIGENRSEAKCFGIYQDFNGDFVVYKNKADGSRAVRYAGKDEAFAVNELYMRLKDEIVNQKAHQHTKSTSSYREHYASPRKRKSPLANFWFWFFLWAVITATACPVIVPTLLEAERYTPGYYRYKDNYYYTNGRSWYSYDSIDNDWEYYVPDSVLESDYMDYQSSYENFSDNYSSSISFDTWASLHSNTAGSNYSGSDYDNDSDWNNDSDWDSDYDWDSDFDWDSGYSDWDSDW